MIFKPEMAKRIAEGRKTQTRRPIKPNETICRYKVGRVYTVQAGRGKPGRDQITITEVHEELLGEISLRDAKREGFRTTAEFVAYWTFVLHDGYDPQQRVWVITFARGAHTDQPRIPAARAGSHGHYVANSALALEGCDDEVSVRLQEKYAVENAERHAIVLAQQKQRLVGVVREIRELADDAKARKRLKSIEHHIQML